MLGKDTAPAGANTGVKHSDLWGACFRKIRFILGGRSMALVMSVSTLIRVVCIVGIDSFVFVGLLLLLLVVRLSPAVR